MDAQAARDLSEISKPRITDELLERMFIPVKVEAGKGKRSTTVALHDVDFRLHEDIVRYMEGKGYQAYFNSDQRDGDSWHTLVLKW